MMTLTQRRCPARAPHRPEHRTSPSTAPARAATPFSLEPQGLPAQSACRTQACSSTVYMELRVVAFFRMRQIWSCADPGFGERSKSRANRYRDLPSTVNTESLESASRPAQQIWSYERCSDAQCGKPGAKTWRALQIWSYAPECSKYGVFGRAPFAQRCKNGVISSERSRTGVKATCGGC